MPYSPQFRRKLHEAFGADGAEEFVNSMDGFEASRGDIAELKQEMLAMEIRLIDKIFGAIKELRDSGRSEIKELRDSTGSETRELRDSTGNEIKELRESTRKGFEDVRAAISSLDNKIEQKHAALLTWSFVFWVGAVAAIGVLAGVLRR